jgi:CubicO group peptidase (beta-lactamase class C family)
MGRVWAVMRRVAVPAACAAVVLVASLVPAAAAPPPGPDRGAVDRFLADALRTTRLPGMAVAITRGPKVVHVAGSGTDGRGGSVTPHTQFRIASLTKSFTAAAVLQLVAAGRVDLDAPVQTYLPGFTSADPASGARITVRHLLNQTSGIADTGFPEVTDSEHDLAQRMASMRSARLVSSPGSEFHYSDLNYQVLASLIEAVTGTPWAQHLAEHVFVPLGMRRTVATAAAEQAGRAAPDLAQGHVLVFGTPVARPELDGLVAGSTGVVSTAEDMARWLVANSAGGGALLPPEMVTLMQTPPRDVPGDYGMGWQVVTPEQGPRRIEHTGVLSTFSAVQVLLPDSGYGFALLFDGNSALADTAGLAAGLAALLAGRGGVDAPRSTLLVGAVLGGACAVVLVARTRSLLRLPRWRRRWAGRPGWRAVPGLVWLLLPVVLLAALPAIVRLAAGRSFTFWQLCLAMPDLVILLAVAALTGTAVAAARVVTLARRDRGRETT